MLPALVSRFDFDAVLAEDRADNADLVETLLQRARAEGLIRPDAATGDIIMMTVRLSRAFPPWPDWGRGSTTATSRPPRSSSRIWPPQPGRSGGSRSPW